jgi:hypothetical protein
MIGGGVWSTPCSRSRRKAQALAANPCSRGTGAGSPAFAPVIPRPFAPEWIPDSVVVGLTVVAMTAIGVAFWWNVVRKAARRRRAELAFCSGLVLLLAAFVYAADETVVPTRSRERKFTVRFRRAAEGHYVGEAHFDFSWEESVLTGRQLGRVVRVTRHVASQAPPTTPSCDICKACDYCWRRNSFDDSGRTRFDDPPRRTSIPVPHVEIMLVDVHRQLWTEELLEDLWVYRDAPDSEATGRALWNTIRRSRLALEWQELTELVTQFN